MGGGFLEQNPVENRTSKGRLEREGGIVTVGGTAWRGVERCGWAVENCAIF